MKQVLLVASIVISAFFVIQWFKSETPVATTGKGQQAPILKVEAIQLVKTSSPIELQSFGNLLPEQQFKIHALVGGQVTFKSPLFKDGARVSPDTVLVKIDPGSFELAVASARSELAAAKLALEDEQARAEQAERDWATRNNQNRAKDFVLRKPHLEAARARLEAARVGLKNAERDLARTEVQAGFDGLISDVSVDIGAVVTASAALGHGFADSLAEIRLPINASDLRLLRHNAQQQLNLTILLENTLTTEPEIWPARFERIEANVEQQSQQVFIVATVNEPFTDVAGRHALLPGQYLKATISGAEMPDIFVVANSAIYQGSYVYLATGENKDRLERRDIEILHRSQNSSIVKAGLSEGEWLVTTVLGQLASGTQIEVTK